MAKTFKDNQGREWEPEINAWTLMKFGEESGATIQDVMNMTIKVRDMMKFLWFACEDQAEERKLSEKDFLKSLEPASLQEIMAAIMGELEATIPGIDLNMAGVMQGVPAMAKPVQSAGAGMVPVPTGPSINMTSPGTVS